MRAQSFGLMVFILVVSSSAFDRRCMQPMKSGPCLALVPSYGFNWETRDCELFTYGGCGGNWNRFDTYEGCMQRCGLFLSEDNDGDAEDDHDDDQNHSATDSNE
ncbi:hypothetical protein FGIG_07181 [Fasciola gigantica]|uniref:BPTI/Kunitz inhibitor domain-containing protein n=1 Tax=Fasciola gigantica TaxID=46835 RepID=A0A504YXZ8_FASGI|nr:hypothetical protein FGIG_07181 [Fasciola gigantica]